MINLRTIAAAGVAALLSTSFAYAGADPVPPGNDGFTKYGEVEGWNVFVDNEKKSCLIERVDEVGNVVQMGLTKDHDFGYLGVFTKADIGIKKGKKQKIYIDLGGNLYWSHATDMKGNITDGYQGGYILANNPEFINDLANKYTMIVFPKKDAAFVVDLTGTLKAMTEAKKCNAEQG